MAHFILVVLWGVILEICFFRQDELPQTVQIACLILGLMVVSDFIMTKLGRPRAKKKNRDTE